jgi:hypothetical protein
MLWCFIVVRFILELFQKWALGIMIFSYLLKFLDHDRWYEIWIGCNIICAALQCRLLSYFMSIFVEVLVGAILYLWTLCLWRTMVWNWCCLRCFMVSLTVWKRMTVVSGSNLLLPHLLTYSLSIYMRMNHHQSQWLLTTNDGCSFFLNISNRKIRNFLINFVILSEIQNIIWHSL